MNKGVLGRKIKKARLGKNFSQSYLATQLEISQSQYAKIENGRTELSIQKLHQISILLEFNLPKFIEEALFDHYTMIR